MPFYFNDLNDGCKMNNYHDNDIIRDWTAAYNIISKSCSDYPDLGSLDALHNKINYKSFKTNFKSDYH